MSFSHEEHKGDSKKALEEIEIIEEFLECVFEGGDEQTKEKIKEAILILKQKAEAKDEGEKEKKSIGGIQWTSLKEKISEAIDQDWETIKNMEKEKQTFDFPPLDPDGLLKEEEREEFKIISGPEKFDLYHSLGDFFRIGEIPRIQFVIEMLKDGEEHRIELSLGTARITSNTVGRKVAAILIIKGIGIGLFYIGSKNGFGFEIIYDTISQTGFGVMAPATKE